MHLLIIANNFSQYYVRIFSCRLYGYQMYNVNRTIVAQVLRSRQAMHIVTSNAKLAIALTVAI